MTRAPVFSRLYSLAWKLARPFLRRNRRLRDGWEDRLVPAGWAEPSDIWIQAASGGEAYLAAELADALADGNGVHDQHAPSAGMPKTRLRLLLTTWTRQGMDVLTMVCSDLEAHRPGAAARKAFFPLDDPALMRRALAMVRPKVIVLLEAELWPGLLGAARDAGIPVVIANGRLTAKSMRGYAWLAKWMPRFWKNLAPAAAGVLTEGDCHRLAALFPDTPVRVVNNIKFDRAVTRAVCDTEPVRNVLGSIASASGLTEVSLPPIRLLASTREEEEAMLLPVVVRLAEAGSFVIVAPRHLHRTAVWEAGLKAAGVAVVRRSAPSQALRGTSVVIWDAFGELNQLYALADSVFIGGSLADLGGQNMLEPLAHGLVPCVGPYTGNFTWATDGVHGLKAAHLIKICLDGDAVAAALAQPERQSRQIVQQRFADWLEPRRGGTAATAELVRQFL